MHIARAKYKAYTLVEFLVVLAIFAIIGTIGIAAFYGLRDSITMNEQIQTLSQELRFAQRSALFLERQTSERWIYGVGIDFSNLQDRREYNVYKWCSQFDEYGDVKTKGDFPNYDKTFPVGNLNGNFPITNYIVKDCDLGVPVSELVKMAKGGDLNMDSNFDISFPEGNNAIGDVGGVPVYVVFESVSGRAFFYDSSGSIVNFDSNGKIIGSPIDLVFEISSPRTKTKKIVSIDNISGKVVIETEKI